MLDRNVQKCEETVKLYDGTTESRIRLCVRGFYTSHFQIEELRLFHLLLVKSTNEWGKVGRKVARILFSLYVHAVWEISVRIRSVILKGYAISQLKLGTYRLKSETVFAKMQTGDNWLEKWRLAFLFLKAVYFKYSSKSSYGGLKTCLSQFFGSNGLR